MERLDGGRKSLVSLSGHCRGKNGRCNRPGLEDPNAVFEFIIMKVIQEPEFSRFDGEEGEGPPVKIETDFVKISY